MYFKKHKRLIRAAALAAVAMSGVVFAEGEPVAAVAKAPAVTEPAPVVEPKAPVAAPLPFDIPKMTPEDAKAAMPPPRGNFAAPLISPPPPPAGAPVAHPAGVSGAPNVPIEDIRDIRGPLHVSAALPWPWIAAAAVAGLLLLTVVWKLLKRHGIFRPGKPYELAFARLEKARKLMQPERSRAFSYVVSRTVRSYIDKQYRMSANRRTTQEFIRDLLDGPEHPLQSHSALLRDFLQHCDLAKYGQWDLSVNDMQSMHQSAWRFVEETRPRPEEEAKKKKKKAETEPAMETAADPALAVGGAS